MSAFFRSSSFRASRVGFFALILVALFSRAALSQRLPEDVRPDHYSLLLSPNLEKASFTGEESIQVTLLHPADAITLNAVEIHFRRVSAEAGGRTFAAEVSLDPAKQQATFRFAEVLPAGPLTLKISYDGILNSDLRGFYLSKTAKRNYAVSQFEPTDARRAFPSFDEPALKATFDIGLVVAKGDTAISNANVLSDTPGPMAGQHTVRFARTPRMSTYLVALLVGDFQCLSGASDGVPIRACATPEHVQDGAYALTVAEFVLHYYDTYFGIKYPMPKLDLIALPDFEAGAMENFGAITFREPYLLVSPKAHSIDDENLVAGVVAHEMAHQWFGDMVTMKWWDNLWLNEGFASWMSGKPLAAWQPARFPRLLAGGVNGTLDLDARSVTRSIRATADTPDQINEMFDGITYGKASTVLAIVEKYVGEETFRKGVHAYLAAHMYGNATAEDFWNAQTQESHKPVDRIMASLVTQPGEPILIFGAVHNGKVEVSQQRFFLNPRTTSPSDPIWTLPVCMKSDKDPKCQLLSDRKQTLKVPVAPVFFADAGGRGYYRTQYDRADYEKLISQVESALDQEDRIALLGNQWALTRANKGSIGDYLGLVSRVRDDQSLSLMQTVESALATIDQRLVSTDEEHRQLSSWVRKTFNEPLSRLGPGSPQDTIDVRELRATLFGLLGSIGDDPVVVAQARTVANAYLENPAAVDGTLGQTALQISAQNGDRTFYDQVQRVSETTNNPQLQIQALLTLPAFRDPSLVERTLQYAVSGNVKNQNSIRLIVSELSARSTRDQAWQFVQQNWPRVVAQTTTTSGGRLVSSTGNFCSADRGNEVSAFFAEHRLPASEHALNIAQNSINDCIELRSAQGADLKQWLDSAESTQGVVAACTSGACGPAPVRGPP